MQGIAVGGEIFAAANARPGSVSMSVFAGVGRVCTYMGKFGVGLLLLSLAAMLRVKPLTPFFVPDFTRTLPVRSAFSTRVGRGILGCTSAGSTWLMNLSYWEKLRGLDFLLVVISASGAGVSVSIG
jgi:hypothetical protein